MDKHVTIVDDSMRMNGRYHESMKEGPVPLSSILTTQE